MTAAETLRAAATQLRDRWYFERTGEPDTNLALDTALARWLDQAADAFEGTDCPDAEPALAVARAVLGEVAGRGE